MGSLHPSHGVGLSHVPERAPARPHHARRCRRCPCGLTRRELEILRLISTGATNHAVARSLWVTDETVKFHLANVYRRLHVHDRRQAARWAAEHGLLDPSREPTFELVEAPPELSST
jgi:DNA-binding NarL/FixJ family response regulator